MPTATLVAPPLAPADRQKPFLIELQRLDETPHGYFRPHARLVLLPELRTSGLWHALPPEEFKNMLLMLTFLTANGWCHPTVQQIAAAMNTSEAKARARMERLTQTRWREEALVKEIKRENGLDAWTPADALIEVQDAPSTPAMPISGYRSAGRNAIIAHSRARYARPRAEVERQIAAIAGWDMPGGAAEAATLPPEELRTWLHGRLLRLGVPLEQADLLMAEYDLERVRRQIEWLPYRNAKSPARFLVAAIEGDYAPPVGLRQPVPVTTALPDQPLESEGIHDNVTTTATEPSPESDETQPGMAQSEQTTGVAPDSMILP